MSWLRQFDHDVFISYGRAALINQPSRVEQWARALRNRLERDLREHLSRDASVFLDGHQPAPTELVLRYASRAALMLFVISADSWRPDSFCLQELKQFKAELHPNRQTGLRQYCAILRGDPQPHSRPEDLPEMYPLDFSMGSKDNYQLLLSQVKEQLLDLRNAIESTVFIAPASPQLAESANRLRKEFRIGAHRREPVIPAPTDHEQEFESNCQRLLRYSGSSVHLLDADFDVAPAEWTRSSQLLALQLACERFGDQRNRVFVYAKPDSQPKLSNSALIGTGSLDDLRGSPLEALLAHMREVMGYKPAATLRPMEENAPDERWVYFQCSPADEPVCVSLGEHLKPKNISLLLGAWDGGSLQKNWEADRSFINRWSKAVLYWGQHKRADVLRYGGRLAGFPGEKILALDPSSRWLNLPGFRTVTADQLESEL